MATRRRRSTTAQPKPDPTPTHEEMLEVAAEREAIEEVVEEEVPMEVILSAALADTFEAIQRAEEEKGVDDFFDPSFYEQPKPEVRLPAQASGRASVPVEPKPLLSGLEPRYLVRQNRTTKYRRG